jgi:hypothetical protein
MKQLSINQTIKPPRKLSFNNWAKYIKQQTLIKKEK